MGWSEKQFADLCEKAGVKPEDAFKTGRLDLSPEHKASIHKGLSEAAKKKHANEKRVKKGYETRIRRGVCITQPKPNSPLTLVEAARREVESDEGPDTRIRVCIEGSRRRCMDADNFTGGLKSFVDALQLSGLIPSDSWTDIKLEPTQKKVSSWQQERTRVTIEYPDPK
jgi:hypothetical protein